MDNINIEETDISGEPEAISLDTYLNSIETDLNELIMDPTTSGYDSLEQQDITYGITLSIGIDPANDSVLDLGAGIGEFYSYTERFTGNKLNRYIGVDNDPNLNEIVKFRYNNDQTINTLDLDYIDFIDGYRDYNPTALKNLEILGNTDRIDWVVSCNCISDTMGPNEIYDIVNFWSSVPEKGAAFTFKITDVSKMTELIKQIFSSETLSTKTIIRSDFTKNWYSLYIYNLRS